MDTHESIFAWPLTLIETSRPLRAKLEFFKYKGSHFSDDFPMIDTFLFSRKLRLSIKYLICLSPIIFNL